MQSMRCTEAWSQWVRAEERAGGALHHSMLPLRVPKAGEAQCVVYLHRVLESAVGFGAMWQLVLAGLSGGPLLCLQWSGWVRRDVVAQTPEGTAELLE